MKWWSVLVKYKEIYDAREKVHHLHTDLQTDEQIAERSAFEDLQRMAEHIKEDQANGGAQVGFWAVSAAPDATMDPPYSQAMGPIYKDGMCNAGGSN